MVTKAQACVEVRFKELNSTRYWKANGACKTWITRPNEFRLPIKHGLYSFSYISHLNSEQFEVV